MFLAKILMMMTLPLNLAQAALKSDGKTHLIYSPNKFSAVVTVDKGFHFNLDAPTYLMDQGTKLKPQSAVADRLEFLWQKPLSSGAKIQYYVCDDAKTVCEPHSELLSPGDQASQGSTEKNKTTKVTEKPSRDSHGFLLNQWELALQEAKKQKKLILMDFTASWCPACIRLDHETFKNKSFKKVAPFFVLLKLDVDLDKNQELREQYSVNAFPTLIVADSDGVEIQRLLDFVPADILVPRLNQIREKKNLTLNETRTKALGGNKEAAIIMAKNAFLAQRSKECLDWFNKAEAKPLEYHLCHISEMENSPAPNFQKALREAIDSFPESFYSIDWRLQLAQQHQENKNLPESEKILKSNETLIEKWLSQPEMIEAAKGRGELTELDNLVIPELYSSLGQTYEALGKKRELAHEQYQKAIQSTLKLHPSVDNPTIIIYLVSYLKKDKDFKEALSWLDRLSKAYPGEFTYPHRQASLLFDNKNFQEALPLATKAYELSYGNNRLKTGLLLVKIKSELQNKKEARSLIDELLQSKAAKLKTNKYILEKLEKTQKELL